MTWAYIPENLTHHFSPYKQNSRGIQLPWLARYGINIQRLDSFCCWLVDARLGSAGFWLGLTQHYHQGEGNKTLTLFFDHIIPCTFTSYRGSSRRLRYVVWVLCCSCKIFNEFFNTLTNFFFCVKVLEKCREKPRYYLLLLPKSERDIQLWE